MSRQNPRSQMLTPQSKQLMEKPFRVNFYSKMEDNTYAGTFVAKRPNARDQMRIVGLKSELLEGRYYDEENPGCGVPQDLDSAAEMIAYLDVCIVSSPDWWDGAANAFDMELISTIFLEAAKADPFRAALIAGDDRDGGDGEDRVGQRDQSRSDDNLASMVDEEIQAPHHQY